MTGIVKVAGMWELGYQAPYTEFDLWSFPLRDFGVDEWIMAPVSGVKKGKLVEVEKLNTAIMNNKDLDLVYVDEDGEIGLQEFEHPENVLYVLGRAGFSPMRSVGGGTSVRVETPGGRNLGLPWPHQIISIVLYDRMIKQWQSQ